MPCDFPAVIVLRYIPLLTRTTYRSQALAKIARAHEPHVAIVADTLDLPHPLGRFDFAISIAVVHHLSTPSRRIAAVKEILGSLRAPRAYVSQASRAKALIYVWALEQKGSRRGWDEGDKQDVMVPWVSKVRQDHEIKTAPSFLGQDRKRDQMWNRETRQEPETSVTFQRYYHLYRANELEQDILAAGGIIFSAGYERDNWWAIAGQAHH